MNGSAGLPGAHDAASIVLAAVFPDWWGRPSELVLAGPANYNERTFYAGAIALVLAAVALASREAGDASCPSSRSEGSGSRSRWGARSE